jgi:hypothetical protein
MLDGWHAFYILLGTAAVALLFVAVSIGAGFLSRESASPTFSTRGLRQRFWWGEGVRKRVASKGRVGNSPVV